jgi:rare lipoprotein A
VALCAIAALALAGCASAPKTPRIEREAGAPPSAPARPGGYYLDDGPGSGPPPDLSRVPDAQPRPEPLHRAANSPYVVFGREYVPERNLRPFRQRGVASWYGRRFHGSRTSSGEPYDMYAMTAAHPTLPIPSYARVTNVANGRSVVVRINDRGPFLHGRIIDLSYAAAWKLGYVAQGSALVDVEAIVPGDTPAAAPRPELPPPAADTVEVPVAAESGGVYVQLGAFSAPENAESLRARLALELARLDRTIEIHRRDGLYRLHVGPYRTREEANAVADEIRRAFDVQPHLVVR